MVPAAWPWTIVAAAGLVRFTENVLVGVPGGSGIHCHRDGLLDLADVEDESGVGGMAA